MDSIYSIYLSVIASISIIGSMISRFLGTKTRKKESNFIEKEINSLDNIAISLNDLKRFVDSQKVSLIENEKLIQELEKKKKELKPLIETQEQTVEGILKAYSHSQKRLRWFDYLIGFFIGVASSAIVTLIFYYIQQKK